MARQWLPDQGPSLLGTSGMGGALRWAVATAGENNWTEYAV